jgi:protein-S-isoprenylcysteine O-methyltransferase Ste14
MSENIYQAGSYNRLLGRLRGAAVFILVSGLLALARPTLPWAIAGTVLVALGEAVRFWASGHLLKTTELITSGPYRYSRNPLYLGRLLIFTGLCMAAALPAYANWVVLILGWAVFFGYYLRRKERVEPDRLRRFHGEAYERYFQAVPALFPTPRPYAGGNAGTWSAKRMLRNREQWMVVALTLISGFLCWRALP